jgi:hypothetical protein
MKKIHLKAAIAFFIAFLLCAFVGSITIQNRMNAENERMERLILEQSYRLNQVISRQLYRTQALAALVIKGDGTVENFQEIASVIASDVPALAAFLLAPGGIVVDAYPLEENPTVIGLDFFDEDDHEGNREAMYARDTGTLVMGGPFILRRGVMGLTGRHPVYINNATGELDFWGLVAVSLTFPEALDDAQLSMLEHQGLGYELWRINPDTLDRQVIAGNKELSPDGAYIERAVNIHNAQWYFRIFPVRSWFEYPETWLLFFGALSISLFVAFIIQNKELEMTKSKVSIMLSQIQPHFLHNALTAIAQLCDEDPAMAKKATIDFSTYLRNNMESLSRKELISIEKEINHVRAYLDLEKVIYGDALTVVFQIHAGGFLLPPLSIQPIVENAVKHGIGKKESGGTITVSIHEDNGGYLIKVVDDGAGYDIANPQWDGRDHVGIDNVRQRIVEQCGGTLEISSEIDRGTNVLIRIPKL